MKQGLIICSAILFCLFAGNWYLASVIVIVMAFGLKPRREMGEGL